MLKSNINNGISEEARQKCQSMITLLNKCDTLAQKNILDGSSMIALICEESHGWVSEELDD